MKQEIMVSIVCNTYNQEDTIRNALDGFLMQQTSFAYEILVHDDASTDQTARIIREYELKHPDLIRPIYEKENQYRKGYGTVSDIQFSRVKGKYIAMCEGDDYWTDAQKLQKQVEMLERHPEADICAHRTAFVDAKTNRFMRYVAPKNENAVIGVGDVIEGGGGFVATCSLLFRTELNERIPRFRQLLPIDYTLQIQGALRGGMIYLNDCMGTYRWRSQGSWTSTTARSVEKQTEHLNSVMRMLHVLNEELHFRYRASVEKTQLSLQFSRLELTKSCREMLREPYRPVYRALPLGKRLKIRFKIYFPFLIPIKRKIWRRLK